MDQTFRWDHHNAGPNLLRALRNCCSAVGRYAPDDPMIDRNLSGLSDLISDWFREHNELSIRLEEDNFSFNGFFLEPIQNRDPAVNWMRRTWKARRIYEMRFLPGMSLMDVSCLIGVLMTPAEKFRDVTVAHQIMANASITAVQVNPPSVEDSFLAPDSGFAWDGLDHSTLPLSEDVRGEPKLSLSEAERLALYDGAMKRARSGQSDAVLKMLQGTQKLIREPESAQRFHGVSCYQVLVEVLIDARQDQALYPVVKSMAGDFKELADQQSLAVHLETYRKLLDFFQDRNFKPMVFCLTIMAELKKKRPALAADIDHALVIYLTPNYLEALLTAARVDPELRPYLTRLLEQADALVDNLLEALFASDDKSKRKLLLDALLRPGKMIHADIMRRLHMAVSDGAPWYVKRNLLVILAANPPTGLADLVMHMWREEVHPKVRGQLERCLFAINDQDCITLGRETLESATEADLARYIRLIETGLVKDYATDLIQMVDAKLPPKIKHLAVVALGRFDQDNTRQKLREIVNEARLGRSRYVTDMRVAAIRALSEDPFNHSYLESLRNDKDPKVIQAVEMGLSNAATQWSGT